MSFLLVGAAAVGVGAGVAKAISGGKAKKAAKKAEAAAKAEMQKQVHELQARVVELSDENQELKRKAKLLDDLVFDSINTSQKPYDADTINSQIKVNREILQEKINGKYTNNLNKKFFDIPLEIPIVRKDKTSEGQEPIGARAAPVGRCSHGFL